MIISSPAFIDGGKIPIKYTCLGDGVNPPLTWEKIPVNSKSLVLIMDDPDAVSGVFSHWILWDIPLVTIGVAENSVPDGAVVGQGTSGQNTYVPPCPPSGEHRYRFKLFALDKELYLSTTTTQEELEKAMGGHILDQAILIGLFKK